MKRLLNKEQRADYIRAYGKDHPWVRENVLGLPPLPEPEFELRWKGGKNGRTILVPKQKAKA